MLDNLEQEPNQQPLEQAEQELSNEPTIEDQQVIEEPEGEPVAELESSDEAEEFFLLGEEEVPVSQINEWRKGHMMQSDYTKKTQDLSDKRKAIEEKESKVSEKIGSLDNLIGELEAELVGAVDEKEMEELLDIDPSEYLRKQKTLSEKRERIESLKAKSTEAKQSLSQEALQRERTKLFADNPDWLDSTGNTTKKFESDQKMINGYLADSGYTAEDVAGIVNAKHWKTIQDAARYQASKGKVEDVANKVKKAPKVTKPSRGQTGLDAEIAQARVQLKKTGSDQDYIALEKLLNLKGKK